MEENKCSSCLVCKLACALTIIGGLNWGLVGLGYFLNMNLNVVNLLLGTWPMVEYIVYLVVGVAAIVKMFSVKCPCHKGACCTMDKK